MKKVIVKLDNVSKSYDSKNYIVKNLDLEVYEGEFLTLLGPSGCGKTTILRMISGLEEVTDGKVYIDEKDVTDLDPTLREVNTIFQNLALFPHMSVYDNIAFGLRMKNIPKNEIDIRVRDIIKMVELTGLENRLPAQISGGQQQRVSLARGIVMNPKVLLLDESLCSLDLKLKRAMQIELKKFQKRLGITFIYVTHDQDEALTMSDRIAVMDNGIIMQDDTPQNIYRNPKNAFVADFIGESNIFKGKITSSREGKLDILLDNGIKFSVKNENEHKKGETINVLVRPENIKIYKSNVKDSFPGEIKDIIYDGSVTKLFVKCFNKLKLRVNVHGNISLNSNEEIYLKIEDKSFVIME